MNSLGLAVSKGLLEAVEDYDSDTKVSSISIKGSLKCVEVVPEERVKKKMHRRILSEEDITFWQLPQLKQDLDVNKKIIDRSNLEFVR
jgi:DNA-directed RNA polymerase subunit H (RpoH/RPB5)